MTCGGDNGLDELKSEVKKIQKQNKQILKQGPRSVAPNTSIPVTRDINQRQNFKDIDDQFNNMANLLKQVESKKDQV